MVVEYVGQLVRRSVVGLREEREYNAACGAGTYVFGMGAGLCIDATQVPKKKSSPIFLTSTLHSCAYCCEAVSTWVLVCLCAKANPSEAARSISWFNLVLSPVHYTAW